MNRASCPDKWPTVKWRCLLKYFSMGTQLLCKIIINLRDSSAPFWRKCLKQTYPEIIVGSQRRDSMVQVTCQETCVTWVMITFIRRLWTVEPWSMLSIGNWIMRHPLQRTGRHLQQKTANHLRLMELFLVWGSLINNQYIHLHIFQLSITVYDNNVMQVKGSTFLLWTLECFPSLSRLVDEAMSIEVSYTNIHMQSWQTYIHWSGLK